MPRQRAKKLVLVLVTSISVIEVSMEANLEASIEVSDETL